MAARIVANVVNRGMGCVPKALDESNEGRTARRGTDLRDRPGALRCM
jgi:hypothetical protein